ncbi:acyltransferase [soil metagenome]
MTSSTPIPEATESVRPVRWFSSKTVSAGLSGHANSFGVIRLVLASAVIFSHAFPLGGWGEDPLLAHSLGQENVGGIAVLGFFAISGYLIMKSGLSSDPLQFIWRRVLRIFPAFWVALIVAAFIVGPIAWIMVGHPLGTYFSFGANGPFAYVLGDADLRIRHYGVYDVFATTTPYGKIGGAVFNGAIWTLYYEWSSYLIIFVLLVTGILKRATWLVPVLTAFYFLANVVRLVSPGATAALLPLLGDRYQITLPLIFLYGACIAMYSKRITLDVGFAALAAVIALLTLWKGGLTVLGYPAIAYLVIWLAAALPRSFHWIGRKNDYSYGIYVYGFLVAQFTAFLGWYHLGYIPWTIATLIVTAGCAWLSWHGVEKRALALKDFGPGKGLRYWRDRIVTRRRGSTFRPVEPPQS